MNQNYEIKKFEVNKATSLDWEALNKFSKVIKKEFWPDDPAEKTEDTIHKYKAKPDYEDIIFRFVWNTDSTEIIGTLSFTVERIEENQHLADFYIVIRKEMRRKGIAKDLLSLVVDFAKNENRSLLIIHSSSKVPAGEAFMKRLDAELGSSERTSRLVLADFDNELIHLWQKRAKDRAEDFKLGFWVGRYPEEDIEAFTRMFEIFWNSAPRDNLKIDDEKWTPEKLRKWENALEKGKYTRWTMYARKKETGEFAGFTEVLFDPSNPELLYQEDTGVSPEFRNLGLGRWLKATMIEKIISEHPEIKHVMTGNSTTNDAMLKINTEMGYKLYCIWNVWQIETDKVRAYLEE
jgi:RimJ/RimL family protein N-acetyltransferase